MITFSGILKAVPFAEARWIISTDGTEHVLVLTNSGCLLYLRPKDGLSKIVYNSRSSNSYGAFFYSTTANAIYFQPEARSVLIEIDLDTLDVKGYDYTKYISTYVNSFQQTSTSIVTNLIQSGSPATDGHVYLATIAYRHISNIVKFDVNTKTFSTPGLNADLELEILHSRADLTSVNINNGPVSLRGYYTEQIYTPDYQELYATIISELNASGLSYTRTQNFQFYLHWDDRAIGSATRRLIVRAPNWKIIDIKSTSVFIDSGSSNIGSSLPGLLTSLTTWTDNLGNDVNESSWIIGTQATQAGALGITLPSYDPNIHYNRPSFVGRFPYHTGNYMADKNIYNHFAYDPDTGQAIFPDTFNKLTTYLNNTQNFKVYRANLPSNQGFSGSMEYVGFVRNQAGNYGYHRPDTKAWVQHDPVANGYTEVNLNSPVDANGLHCYVQEYGSSMNLITYKGKEWQQGYYSKSSINPELISDIDPDSPIATVEVEYTPDVSTGVSGKAIYKGVSTLTGIINSAHQIGTKYIFGGSTYSGISVGEVPVSTYVQDVYIGEKVISIYGSTRWGNRAIFFGYLNNVEIIQGTTRTRVALGNYVNQQMSASPRTNELVFTGTQVRVSNYRDNYFAICYINTSYQVLPFPQLPTIINTNDTVKLRTETNLSSASYSDTDVNTAINAYQLAKGLTRAQVINLFRATTPYRANDVACYNNFVVVNCKHLGISALNGIRINTNEDGVSGTFITSSVDNATRVPTLIRVEKSNLSTIVMGDYKTISINATGMTGKDYLGRMVVTDNYLVFFEKVGTDLIIRAISKTNFEAATTQITSFDKGVTIPLGTSTGGWGNYTNFGGDTDRFLNFAFAQGDFVYASLVGSIASGPNWVIAYKIDIANSSYTPFIISSDRTTVTTMTYNPDTDDATISRGTGAKTYEDITVASLPLTY